MYYVSYVPSPMQYSQFRYVAEYDSRGLGFSRQLTNGASHLWGNDKNLASNCSLKAI